MSNLVDLAAMPVIELWGETVLGRRVEGERITLALIELEPDAILPVHQHEAEQLGMILMGTLNFTIGDERRELGPGQAWRIPSGVPHGATVGPDGATVVDVFSPIRSDWDALPNRPSTTPVWLTRDRRARG